jgi:hypothetical protein
MGTRDPRVDAFAERSADFAQPILTRIREIVHDACPQVLGQFGRNPSVKDLPVKTVLRGYVKKGNTLNEAGTPGPMSRRAKPRGEPEVPEDLLAELEKNQKARSTFEGKKRNWKYEKC